MWLRQRWGCTELHFNLGSCQCVWNIWRELIRIQSGWLGSVIWQPVFPPSFLAITPVMQVPSPSVSLSRFLLSLLHHCLLGPHETPSTTEVSWMSCWLPAKTLQSFVHIAVLSVTSMPQVLQGPPLSCPRSLRIRWIPRFLWSISLTLSHFVLPIQPLGIHRKSLLWLYYLLPTRFYIYCSFSLD